jgi:hypothetical protein
VANLASKLRFSGSFLRIAVTHPVEFVDRMGGRLEVRRQGPRGQVDPNRTDPSAAAHELLGITSCPDCDPELRDIEAEVAARLVGSHRHDGGTALARVLWMVARHTRPEQVVETGVARGVSSAYLLDALDRNGAGHLWSIDLPPVRPGWRVDVGSAVPDRLRPRWTYVRGASRRHLPRLVERIGDVQLFVHDGMHTVENMAFELDRVWPHLGEGAVVVADDADANRAFVDFAQRVDRAPLLVAEPAKQSVVGLLRR